MRRSLGQRLLTDHHLRLMDRSFLIWNLTSRQLLLLGSRPKDLLPAPTPPQDLQQATSAPQALQPAPLPPQDLLPITHAPQVPPPPALVTSQRSLQGLSGPSPKLQYEEALVNLGAKKERRQEWRSQRPKGSKTVFQDHHPDSDYEDDPMPVQLDDFFEYSDEVEDLDDLDHYPFGGNEPEVGDFVLVELEVEEGRHVGAKVHYVGKILTIEKDAGMTVSFLWKKSVYVNGTICFPIIEDVTKVEKRCCREYWFPSKKILRNSLTLSRFLSS